MNTITVLVIDDHPLFAEALAARLSREPDLAILPVATDSRQVIAAPSASMQASARRVALWAPDRPVGYQVLEARPVVEQCTSCNISVVCSVSSGGRDLLPLSVVAEAP
jgi:DNA-binding NarL/FixJ family response regulator